ncbi:MAG: alpha/beta hydrolase [Synergistetes bacterium HGW-Synergistetes-2]|nr:MAG: alpha/beta hydrolase [Synergistetes bacterium HGW-Synergistetes-2]
MFKECITSDPPRDPRFPPSAAAPTILSGGEDIFGLLYTAQGKGPHPTMLFLHGFPGNEKNLDLVQIFRRAGFNTMFFSYRGAWGSHGSFSFTNVLEDSLAAVDFLRSDEARTQCFVDGERIVLVGHSMGGFAAIKTAAARSFIKETISLSGWNIGLDGKLFSEDGAVAERVRGLVDDAAPRLAGTSREALIREIAEKKDVFDLRDAVGSFSGRSVLLVGASEDNAVPPETHHELLLDAFRETGGVQVENVVLDDDHSYSASRVALAKVLLEYLEKRGY